MEEIPNYRGGKTLDSSIPSDNPTQFLNLPKDIHLSIFSNLPFKSYIACRGVCKQWRRFFSDPDFAKTRPNPKVIFRSDSQSFCSVDYEKSNDNSSKPSNRYLSVKSNEYYRIYGSCNGLLCVAIDNNGKYKIALWNPSTGDYRILPDANPLINTNRDITNCFTSSLVGFGYDSFSEDYKIVRVFLGYVYEFDLFSLKTNSWKVIKPLAPPLVKLGFCYDNVGTTINGTIYWLLLSESNSTGKLYRWIVAFDLKHDKFVEIEMPPCDPVNSYDSVKITTVGNYVGLSCFSYYDYNRSCDSFLSIWGMYKDKWIKLIMVSADVMEIPSWVFVTTKPLCFFENGRKILFQIVDYVDTIYKCPGLLVYDTKIKKTVEIIPFHGVSKCQDLVIYTETLVSPNALDA